jgi:hypothetical protein
LFHPLRLTHSVVDCRAMNSRDVIKLDAATS